MPSLIGGVDYLQATGLIARGYSKIVLSPIDIQGGINDIVQGVSVVIDGFSADVPKIIGASLTGTDILQATGLIARGYSKMVLSPTDVKGGVQDILQALVSLGVTLKSDDGVATLQSILGG